MATLFCSAQESRTGVNPEPTPDNSAKRADRLTARQQWSMLRQAEQLSSKAELLEKEGKGAQAERMAERALALQEHVRGSDALEVARSLDELADLYTAHKKDSAAELLYERARGIRDRALSAHPDVYDREGGEIKIRRSQPAEKAGPVGPPL